MTVVTDRWCSGFRSRAMPPELKAGRQHRLRLEYTAEVFNDTGRPLRNVDCFLAAPITIAPHQHVTNLRRIPSCTLLAKKSDENCWVLLRVPTLPNRIGTRFGYEAIVEAKTVWYEAPDELIISAPPPHLQHLTESERALESSHPEIMRVANELLSSYGRTLALVKAAMRHADNHVRYVPQNRELGAAFAVENGVGDCTEKASLMVAICRAAGIASKLQSGFSKSGNSWGPHAWVALWINDMWIPADPTLNSRRRFLGITQDNITMITGNWMQGRFPQEFGIKYRSGQIGHPLKPRIRCNWTIDSISGGN